jgi:magnesium chelatase subunit D
MRPDFPFSAVVGQEDLKLALILIAIDPTIGGVLITGERGTAKSTAARGLAALLPKTSAGKSAPFVELPIGATEDRVIGSLDLSRALREGSTELRSGLLARADGGVLYVDEVNLLPDHIVDLLLDAAASGWVTVERDGISAGESARFVLVGTMNPEEGELRPQFVDRFGLCVQVRGLATHDIRSAAIRQRLAFDDDPAGVLGAVEPQQQALREGIVAARGRLSTIAITNAHLSVVTGLSVEHQVDGIRGDLALIKTARALAAWQAAGEIRDEHIQRAAELALPHRTRQKRSKNVPRAAAKLTPQARAGSSPAAEPKPQGEQGPQGEPGAANGAPLPIESPRLQMAPAVPMQGPLRLITDAIDRELIGRRATDSMNSQRMIGAIPYELTGTLAVAQTLSAAARRGARVSADSIRLIAADLRQHERRGPGLCHVLFLVDASGSMATQRRLEVAKGAALGLLSSSYQRRDEVALMAFRADGTDLVLPFTRHIAGVERALSDVPSGGRTPLARALLDAADVLHTREPALLVLFTDGRANVSAAGGDPWEEALGAGLRLRTACAGAVVIDCESGPIVLGRAKMLAQALGAECVALDDLDDTSLTIRIQGRLKSL